MAALAKSSDGKLHVPADPEVADQLNACRR